MRYLIGLGPLILLAACGHSASAAVDATPTTRSFPVGAFDAVALQGSDDVRVVTGATPGVSASGPADMLDRLDIRVDGTTLKIGRKRDGWHMGWSHNDRNVVITVTTPGIASAAVAGSGNMSVDHATGDNFSGSVAGSGDLALADVRAKRAKFELAGSGNLSAKGVAQDVELSVAGSGDIDATGLVSQTADLSIGGSGNVRAAARQSAKISLAGSGDATVTGTKNCQVSKVGSGEATCTP